MNIQTKHTRNTSLEYPETGLRPNWSVIPIRGSSQAEQFKVATIHRTAFSAINVFNAMLNVSSHLIPPSAADEALEMASYMEGSPIC